MAVGPGPLHREAVYVTPLGRRCRWAPTISGREATIPFEYIAARGEELRAGFSLTPRNLRILRKEAP